MQGNDPRELVARMLDGDGGAAAALVTALTPVMRLRVARVLARRRSTASGRRASQELDDLVQDAWASLLARGGRALLAWDPARGLDFCSFVGFFAERATAMRLRTRKRNPWTEDPTTHDELADLLDARHDRPALEARDRLHRILSQAFPQLGGRGRCYFQLLLVEERSIDAVAAETGSSRDAVYAWRSRFKRLARAIERELDTPSLQARRIGAPVRRT